MGEGLCPRQVFLQSAIACGQTGSDPLALDEQEQCLYLLRLRKELKVRGEIVRGRTFWLGQLTHNIGQKGPEQRQGKVVGAELQPARLMGSEHPVETKVFFVGGE